MIASQIAGVRSIMKRRLIAPCDIAGETLPADGTLERGHALVDYASLTGEPLPVEKKEGDVLLSGAINLRAPILLRISHPPALSSFAQLTRELEAALQRPGKFQKQADLYGGLFTPAALAAASAALLYNRAARPWHAALAVLNAATPCPLLIAVPVATLAGLGAISRLCNSV
jgi:P-type E1-E2 ATPase